MSRRRSKKIYLWDFDSKESNSVPNARVALALMQCVRALKGAYPGQDFDDLGEVLAPLVVKHPQLLLDSIEAYEQRRLVAGRVRLLPLPEQSSELLSSIEIVSSMLLDRDVLILIGEAFALSLPTFRLLFEKVSSALDKFVQRYSFPADKNLQVVTELLGLPPPEAALIRLATACGYSSINRRMFGFVKGPSYSVHALDVLCDVRGTSVIRMFDGQGPLKQCGLLENVSSTRNRNDLDDLLQLSHLGEILLGTPFEDEQSMARAVLTPLAASKLDETMEWPHLREQQELVKVALTAAIEDGVKGVNVLIYGGAGTGKTEYVRQLLATIGANAYMVRDADDDGDEASRGERLTYLRLSQTFAGNGTRAVLVLDEAEDIFKNDYRHQMERATSRSFESKAFINNLLETNHHPVIWISNRISQIDPAYLRRFSCCLEFPQTPQFLRRSIAQDRLARVGCSEEFIDSIAEISQVTPAHLDAAARFAGLARLSALGADASVNFVIESHLKASGHNASVRVAPRSTRFDLRYLNVRGNTTPQGVVESLERMASSKATKTGSAMVFSGAPGTGKTQLAAEIASRLGRRLVVRTASDINSKWHGESEQNVAQMFRDCDPRTEVLFLDEAETLLGSREERANRANRAVTGEFLRWLEIFEGVFICATNHANTFDAALMRRFTFRMEFQPLLHQQRVELFAELALGWQPDTKDLPINVDTEISSKLSRLDLLTPGDFANAARRIRALALPTSAWLTELEAEQESKAVGKGGQIGFY